MYRYDEFDHGFVRERVAEFRDQVARRLSGELTEANIPRGSWWKRENHGGPPRLFETREDHIGDNVSRPGLLPRDGVDGRLDGLPIMGHIHDIARTLASFLAHPDVYHGNLKRARLDDAAARIADHD